MGRWQQAVKEVEHGEIRQWMLGIVITRGKSLLENPLA